MPKPIYKNMLPVFALKGELFSGFHYFRPGIPAPWDNCVLGSCIKWPGDIFLKHCCCGPCCVGSKQPINGVCTYTVLILCCHGYSKWMSLLLLPSPVSCKPKAGVSLPFAGWGRMLVRRDMLLQEQEGYHPVYFSIIQPNYLPVHCTEIIPIH